MRAMKIERATSDDLESWAALRHALWGGDLGALRDEARALLESDDQVAFLARSTNACAIGFVEASLRTATAGTYAFVEGWFVAEAERGGGHGARLLEAVEEWALHRGVDALLSDTQAVHYPLSLAAHARAGYVPVSTTTVLLKDLAAPDRAGESEVRSDPASMLHHLSVGVRDIERSARFYDATLGALGYERVWSDLRPGEANQAVGYGVAGGGDQFAIKQRDEATAPGAGSHLAFAAASRGDVDAFHVAALAHGGLDDGAPGLRPHYGPNYYACFVVDPDGHRIEAVTKTVAPSAPTH